MEIEYRLAHPEELEEICHLVAAAVAEMKRNGIDQWDERYPVKEDFAEDIDQRCLYVGWIRGVMAVIFALNQQYDEEYKNGNWSYPDQEFEVLHRLCVNPLFQNQGVGKRTMQFMEEKVRAGNIRAIRLDVFSGNPYALCLYTHMGYRKVGYADWRKGRFYLMEKYL